MQTGVFRTIKNTGLMLGGLGLFLASPAWGADGIDPSYEGEYEGSTATSSAPADTNVDANAPKPFVEAANVGLTTDGGQAACAAPAPACAAPAPTCAAPANCGNGCGCNSGCGSCNLGEPWTLMKALCGEEAPPFKISGWSQWGYTTESDGVLNTHPDHFDAQQQWLYAERIADGSNGWGFGFRADILYGTDAQNTQAFGNPPGSWDYLNGWDHGVYGWAMPQLYAEAAYGKFSVKLGHFYTNQGYEVFAAPGNFFYSHSFTWNFSEPFTHTGVMTKYQVNENTSVHAGWTAGLDTGFDRFDDGSNFHGGVSTKLNDRQTFMFHTCIGDFGARGEGYLHSVILDTAVTDKWQHAIHSDLVTTDFALDPQYSVVNYLFYKINDCYKAGGRFEWWNADGDSAFEITGGLNIRRHANVVVRPEVRYQWASDDAAANFGIEDEFIFGIDAVFTF